MPVLLEVAQALPGALIGAAVRGAGAFAGRGPVAANTVVTNVPGQSSDPRSKHYGDLLPLWGKDEYFPLVYSRKRVEQETEQILWLHPEAQKTR